MFPFTKPSLKLTNQAWLEPHTKSEEDQNHPPLRGVFCSNESFQFIYGWQAPIHVIQPKDGVTVDFRGKFRSVAYTTIVVVRIAVLDFVRVH